MAQIDGRSTPWLDHRTRRHASYWISQTKRKRLEEISSGLARVVAERVPGRSGLQPAAHQSIATGARISVG
jgi:hypothetical protein